MASLRIPALLVIGATALLAIAPARAQGRAAPRLVDSIEAPMLYLSLGSIGGAAADGTEATAQRRTVQQLLADPAFDAILGDSSSAPRAVPTSSSSTRALALVRTVLGKSSGEIEIALTGVVPGVGQPLLVLRAQLQSGEVTRLQQALEDDQAGLATRHRTLQGTQTYTMLGSGGAPAAGEQVELALVGNDLVVANDATAIEELLAPDSRTTASRDVLSANPRFLRLQETLDVPAGSLMVYGDWQRLAQRLQRGKGDVAGLPTFVLRWSGLGSARSVMASLSADDGDFAGTVLLDFDRAGRPLAPPTGRRQRHEWGQLGLDGWFASALSIPARKLVQDLPGGGLGGLVLAVNLRDIARRSHRGADLLLLLRESFVDFGLDFDRNVLSRLGERGTMQLLFRRGEHGELTEIDPIYAIRATTRAAAQDLFKDLRRAAEQHGSGRLLPGRGKRSVEVLELRPQPGAPATFVAAHEGAILVAFDAASIDDHLTESRQAQRNRSRRDADVGKVIKQIGGSDVTGLFDLDFAPWLDRLGALLAGRNTGIDLSGIPRRHIGYLDLQPTETGVMLRICVLSSR